VRKLSAFLLGSISFLLLVAFFAARAADSHRVIQLPTSKNLTLPVPGFIARTNSFPATIAISPDKRYAALLNQGYGTQETGARQSIAILDLSNNQLRDFPDDRLSDDETTRQSYFIGLAFSTDGKHIYASMGSITDPEGEKPKSTGNGIAVYKFANGQVLPERFIKIPPQQLAAGKEVAFGVRKTAPGTAIPYPAGFAVLKGEKGDRLLIANNLSDNAILLDVNSGAILNSFDLSRDKHVPAAYPYTVIANKAGTKAWVSLWNEPDVAELDLSSEKVARWISVTKAKAPTEPSPHPTAMLLSPAEDKLYVSLANADVIDAVDLESGNAFPIYGTGSPGSVLQAIALSPDGKHLFAAAGALDAVTVFELREMPRPQTKSLTLIQLNFIPTEWYPTALAVVGNDLLIATAKGEGSGPNNMMGTLKSERRHKEHPYIPTLIGGSIARLSFADIEKNLPAYTRQVEDDNLLHADPGKLEFSAGKNPIRHVLYILKENRTYDQILGDLSFKGQPVGDGDPTLTMYGADITPNEHKLALQFGVLDNFYDSGEVSGDGHVWSTASTTSDYNEKTWPIAYRSKERTYDFQGAVADEIPLEQGIPDIDDPGTGFIWDNLARSGLTYRIYGEFVASVWCRGEAAKSPKEGTPSALSTKCPKVYINKGEPLPETLGNPHGGPSPWPWPVPIFKGARAGKAALRDHFDPDFPDFNTDYPDQMRADEFLREFDAFVKARGTPKEMPQFTLLYLPDDHTGGTRPGHPTPKASVADNDLAVGRVVDALSHSPYWDDTAIFVIEDDAQDGADHVDAHRSIAFAISKYSPRADKLFVDHHFYTTVNMIHTMEQLLGLRPMNLFDAHAPLMSALFTGPGTQAPYTVDDTNLRNGLIYKLNEKKAAGAQQSLKMDFSRPDANDAQQLNAILWQDAKGNVPAPFTSRSHSAGSSSSHSHSDPDD